MRPLCRLFTNSVSRFLRNKDGATTVDFVVLTAAVIGLSIALYTIIGDDTADHADRIGDKMTEIGIRSY